MKEGKMRKFAYTQRTDNQTVQRLRPLYPLWILEGAGQYCDDNIEKIKGLNYKTQNQDLKLEDHSSTIDQNLDELERKIEKRIHVIKEDIDKPENKDNQDVNDYRTLRIG